MKMMGVSRDGGTKNYTNKSSIRKIKWCSYKVHPTFFFIVTLFLYENYTDLPCSYIIF